MILRERERESKTLPRGKGLPIGNLTSQTFANIYMNELDQFVRHDLKASYYARYTDDFVIIANDRDYLERSLRAIRAFLLEKLKLGLHPNKVSIQSIGRGVDFLGYIQLPHYSLVRTKTRKRIWRKLHKKVLEHKAGKISRESLESTLNSYLGVLSHSNSHELTKEVRNKIWFWLTE